MGYTTVTTAVAAAAVGYAAGYLSSSRLGADPQVSTDVAVPPYVKKKQKAAAAKAAAMAAGEVPAGDVKKGAALFKAKCATCHSCVQGGPTMQGPNLYNIMGQKAGQSTGFKFTKNIKSADITWDNQTMFDWLASPKQMVKGTTMAFQGFKKEQDRNDVIAYLNTLSEAQP